MISNPFFLTSTIQEVPLRVLILGDNTGGFSSSKLASIRTLYDNLNTPAQYCLHVGDIYDGRNDTYDWPYAKPMKYFSDFLNYFNVQGSHSPLYPLSDTLRFFPAIGNHDRLVVPTGAEIAGTTFKNWFNIDQLNYSVDLGGLNLVEIFVLNCTSVDTPDGEPSWETGSNESVATTLLGTTQGLWWQNALATSTATWKITMLHYAPYASVPEGTDTTFDGTKRYRFPFKTLGNDLVLSGHEHVYERLDIDGLPFIVNGLGGGAYRAFSDPLPDFTYKNGASIFRHNGLTDGIGICMLEIYSTKLYCKWYGSNAGTPILLDTLELIKPI